MRAAGGIAKRASEQVWVRKGRDPPKMFIVLDDGKSFGELALMYYYYYYPPPPPLAAARSLHARMGAVLEYRCMNSASHAGTTARALLPSRRRQTRSSGQ